MKKVCHISTAHSLRDSRIFYKECVSLRKHGYYVNYIVSESEVDELEGVKVEKLINTSKSRIYRIVKKRRDAFKKAIEVDADIYHFHDPELIGIGKALKRRGKRVIYDVHEDVPKQILNKKYLGSIWIRKTVSKIFDIYEKHSSKKFDAIISATDEIAMKFKNKNSISIKNYVISEKINNSVSCQVTKDKDKFVIIYVGAISSIRGIREIIQSTEKFNGRVELWILGKWESQELHKECMDLAGYENCKYFGMKPLDEVYGYIRLSDVGLCTLYPTANYKESLPIKVMEYMALGKPIILSDFEYWKNVFGNVGVYVDPLNVSDIAKAIQTLIDDKILLKNIGEYNLESSNKKFVWEIEEEKLLNLYINILGE
ncbi:MAG: glycosyltransferase [Clostridium sp.]